LDLRGPTFKERESIGRGEWERGEDGEGGKGRECSIVVPSPRSDPGSPACVSKLNYVLQHSLNTKDS